MSSSRRKEIPIDSLLQLQQRLEHLPPKSSERVKQIVAMAELYGISSSTVYRSLKRHLKPRPAHRADHLNPNLNTIANWLPHSNCEPPIKKDGTYPRSERLSC